jgi:kynurenine formamidase
MSDKFTEAVNFILSNLGYEREGNTLRLKRFERLKGLIREGLVLELSRRLTSGWHVRPHGPVYIVRQSTYLDSRRRYRDREVPEGTGFATMRLELCDHSGTHLDALNHVSDMGKVFPGVSIGEVREDIDGFKPMDITVLPPLITRGVLFHVPKKEVEEVTVEDLRRSLGGERVERGDAALIYTGWNEYTEEEPGLGLEGAKWLADLGVAVIGNDSPRSEFISRKSKDFFPVHRFLIAQRGIPLIDNMYLEELDRVLLKEGRRDFLLIVLPLRIEGATASPVNPVAML